MSRHGTPRLFLPALILGGCRSDRYASVCVRSCSGPGCWTRRGGTGTACCRRPGPGLPRRLGLSLRTSVVVMFRALATGGACRNESSSSRNRLSMRGRK
jgi:hypothetical protein